MVGKNEAGRGTLPAWAWIDGQVYMEAQRRDWLGVKKDIINLGITINL